MSETIFGNQIMNELKAIRKDMKFLKDHMVDIDCIMTEDDYLALNEYRMEKDSDELVSHEDLKKSLGL
jgi:CHAD domain-containing protein